MRARASADRVFGALIARHVEIVRTARYDHSRQQIIRGALAPSRVFDDTLAWTGGSAGSVRMMEAFGTNVADKYVMTSRRSVPAPVALGDGRHITTLARLAESQFRWETTVDFAIGDVHPADIALVISRLLSAGEGLTQRQARAEVAQSAPRASAVLGETFTLDSLNPVRLVDGSTAVTLSIAVHSDQLARRYPALADYVRRYVDPARFRIVLSDRSGAVYFEAVARDRFLTIKVRSREGRLVPLTGAARAMPDTLVLTSDFSVKVKLFRVGFHDLVTEFVNSSRGDDERAWTVTAKQEPRWNLPLISARLLRAPLRFPFAGEGAMFRLAIQSGAGNQPTLLVRHARLRVQESAILKFINGLTNTAMDDFGTRVETEKALWLREIFVAMRDDARGVLAP